MEHLQPDPGTRLLLTGSGGFIGRHFRAAYGGTPLADAHGRIDLRDQARVHQALATLQPEAVLHLAAQSSVAASFANAAETYAINFLGTLHLLEALSATGFQGVFVYLSSADVYGAVDAAELPIDESQRLRPRNPYAVSKVAAEALCYQFSQTQNFRVVIVRPFNQIGPGQDARFALPSFAQQLLRIRDGLAPPRLVTGDLSVSRDFTDVRDTIKALHLLLTQARSEQTRSNLSTNVQPSNGEIYNLCSGRERTLASLLDELMELAGVTAEVTVDPTRVRPSEQRRMAGSAQKLHEHTGWLPEIATRTTLEDILNSL